MSNNQKSLSRGEQIWIQIDSRLPEFTEGMSEKQYAGLFKVRVSTLSAKDRADLTAWIDYQINQLENVFTEQIQTVCRNMYAKYKLQQKTLQEL